MGAMRRKGTDSLAGSVVIEQEEMISNQKRERFILDIRKKKCIKGSEALKQVAQRGGGCPIPGDIQVQAGWGSEQPDLAIDVPVHFRGVELGDL